MTLVLYYVLTFTLFIVVSRARVRLVSPRMLRSIFVSSIIYHSAQGEGFNRAILSPSYSKLTIRAELI